MNSNTNPDTQTQPPANISTALGDRLAFTPTEFAALFGKSETWGYRAIYAGRVQVLEKSLRLLIPRSEVDKFLSKTVVYNGKPGRSPKARKRKSEAA